MTFKRGLLIFVVATVLAKGVLFLAAQVSEREYDRLQDRVARQEQQIGQIQQEMSGEDFERLYRRVEGNTALIYFNGRGLLRMETIGTTAMSLAVGFQALIIWILRRIKLELTSPFRVIPDRPKK